MNSDEYRTEGRKAQYFGPAGYFPILMMNTIDHCMRSPLFVLVPALLVASCQVPIPDGAVWSGSLQMHNGRSLSLKFKLDLAGTPSGWMIVGDEHTLIPEVRATTDSVILTFAEYDAAIRARWNGSSLAGFYERYRSDTLHIPWSATPIIDRAPPHAAQPPAVALVGSYRVFFRRGSADDTLTSAVFWARGDSIFGSFVAADGDYGLFAGTQQGDTAVLDRFNGWQALKLELRNDGIAWTGELYSRNLPPTPFRIEPRVSAEPVLAADKVTTPRDPKQPFRFSGVDLQGQIVTERSERFRGKVVLVDIMGTWCHNCMDSAPVLERIARQFGPQGLEVVALSFELRDDTSAGLRNLRLFQKKYGLTYTVLYCGSTDDRYTKPALNDQLKNFYAYPTTLFLNRQGRVMDVHAGFRGPGAGSAYQQEIVALFRKAEELLRP